MDRWHYVGGGMGAPSPTGLRWNEVYPLMDRMGLDDEAWSDLAQDLEVMEAAAGAAIRERQAARQGK